MVHACGVDFGTSNSTVGMMRGAAAHLLPLEQDKQTLPSAIFFNADEDQVSYGRAALAGYLSGDEGRLMRSMKSLLGTPLIEGQTEVQGRALPFRALLSQFIHELRQRAERASGQSLTHAVFGRPVHFIDDDSKADQLAQDTLADIARAAGFQEVLFQFEPIAAALDYEAGISKEELVLVADIGGGTSDFSLIRLSPEAAKREDRSQDILANAGVHLGGTDFDKTLSLAHLMPMLGYGGQLANGNSIPSAYYFNLATWHTINLAYTQKVWRELQDVARDLAAGPDKQAFARLLQLVEYRDGHWLAIQAEHSKIALSEQESLSLALDRLKLPQETSAPALNLNREGFDLSTLTLCDQIAAAVGTVIQQAGVRAEQVDTVYFTGGASGVHGLRRHIHALVPQARAVEGDLFGSIGAGLARQAQQHFG